MSDFYRTHMGHRFYEGTMPAIVEQLKRLNDNLEKLMNQGVAVERPSEQPRPNKSVSVASQPTKPDQTGSEP